MPGDVVHYRSRPDLVPARVRIEKAATKTAPGDVFVAPQGGPVQYGPMILDNSGHVVWFDPLPGNLTATDFRMQKYEGQPVITWWQGQVGAGVGVGQDVIENNAYEQIATVRAADGLGADLHEFELTPQGTALITAEYPVHWDASAVHGSKQQDVLDSVVQEIDVKTGLLLFQWDSLDHVPVTDSEVRPRAKAPFDYFHVNSIDLDRDGNLVISSRNTSAAYKVSHATGAVIWRLGGKQSSFTMAAGASFAFQHDVRIRADDDQC